jgi:hypothetical protein
MDPDPDPTPDPTPFFYDFKDVKKVILLKFCVKIYFVMHYFRPLNIFMKKGKDPEPVSHL